MTIAFEILFAATAPAGHDNLGVIYAVHPRAEHLALHIDPRWSYTTFLCRYSEFATAPVLP